MPFSIQAQDLADALRYSSVQVQGTARAGAMGNAFGALGGDFTSVSINPAGIGIYRFGEFTLTPVSGNTSMESNYLGTKVKDHSNKFALNNISYVSVMPFGNNDAGLVSINFGIGYNRLKDFNSYGIMQGYDVKNGSFMDFFADRANRDIWSDYYEELAWKTDMLLYDENAKEYYSDLQDAGYGQNQRKTYSKNGSIDEYSFATGINFNHMLYFGASLGITDLYYYESTTFSETDSKNNIPFFNDYSFNSSLRTSGVGYNLKLGVIVKPINEIRLGWSIQTPTYYKLNDSFSTSMKSNITYSDGSERYDERSPYSDYDYRLETPFRTTFSSAFVISDIGLLSVDLELTNYKSAKLRSGSDGYDFVDENMDINKAYKTTATLRVGGEIRATKAVSLRGGLEYYPSAYKARAFNTEQLNSDANLLTLATGIGYRSGSFFADLAYRYSAITEYDYPYSTPVLLDYPAPEAISFDVVKNSVLFTLGVKF